MKLEEDWLKDERTETIVNAVEAAGYKIYFVGGCVRNSLLGEPVGDIDMSTDALPEVILRVCEEAGLKVVPTGIEHGTVTVVAGGLPHEITTFRRDIRTDGRRAVVEFSQDVADDARRRDFTMNALYCDKAGNIVDPLSGLEDLKARRVRFIEDANQRIREDYLRALRFFRFHAWYGDPQAGMDAEALAAIADNLDGLDKLSADRVGAEMLKLLAAPDPGPAVAAMSTVGVLNKLLPGTDPKWLSVLIHIENGFKPDPIRRLATLGGGDPSDRLRLSRKDRKSWVAIRDMVGTAANAAELGYRYGEEAANNGFLVRAALTETPPGDEDFESIRMGAATTFPVRAADLQHELAGPELGKRLKSLENIWIASGFTATREDLLKN